MKSLLASVILSAAIAAPAFAETPATPAAPATGTATSLSALLDSGYEIRSALTISDEDQQIIWPNDDVAPFMMLVLQKGASVATCVLSTNSIVNVSPTAMASATACRKR